LAQRAAYVPFFILFSSFNRVCRVTNDRKISYTPVISGYPKVPRGNYSFLPFSSRFFREPNARRLPPLAGPNFFMKIQLPSLIGIGKRSRSVEPFTAIPLSRFAIYKSSGKWRHAAHKSSFWPNFQAVANDSFV